MSTRAKWLAVVVIGVGTGCWLATVAEAGGGPASQGPAGGMTTPCGDTGCGPRYCGEKHEPSRRDPCDGCNRWRGCNGVREMPEVLAPWQMPPGRGFRSGAAVGYRPGPCTACGPSWSGR